MRLPHWFGETVHTYQTTFSQLPRLLPVFERRPLGRNRLSDAIVRRMDGHWEPLTVAMVSKGYLLVQHAEAVRALGDELKQADVDPQNVPVRLQLSEYGTRMALSATLPDEFALDPGDGHKMALTFECLNSVDKTVSLFAAVGWFRFICSNGLVVGTTSASVRQRHSASLRIDEFSAVLAEGLRYATGDADRLRQLMAMKITEDELLAWVDGAVAEKWGPLAAARVYGIAATGQDGKPSLRKRPPHARTLTERSPVPGTKAPCQDAYALAQVLAWVAARRTDVAERIRWRSDIPALMNALTGDVAAGEVDG